ncbi:hypothetical protein ACQUSR_32280 [Streptomyces sp. P1-3]|uniref:hypothetical protein n=1 Tax=Streptomyces sp. P1-3 TaxID=3421658 RepID=UPI003D36AF17
MRHQLLLYPLLGLLPGLAGCVVVSPDRAMSHATPAAAGPRATAASPRQTEAPGRAGRTPAGTGHRDKDRDRTSQHTAQPSASGTVPRPRTAPGGGAARPQSPPPAHRRPRAGDLPGAAGVPGGLPGAFVPDQWLPRPGGNAASGSLCDLAGRRLSPEQMRQCRGLYG